MFASLGGKQQSLGIHVVNHGDVVLVATQAGLVDANELHAGKVLQGTGLLDIVLDATPQLLVRAAQQARCLTDRKLPEKRHDQGLEGCREA